MAKEPPGIFDLNWRMQRTVTHSLDGKHGRNSKQGGGKTERQRRTERDRDYDAMH